MTATVLETPRIKTKCRVPLKSIDMATSQAQARPASSAAPGRKGTRSSARLSLSSVEKSEEKTASTKRKQEVFDEEDEGFQFTRIKTKKSKPTVESIPEIPQPEIPAPKPSPRRGRPPKKRPVEKSESTIASKKSSESSTRQTRATAKPTLSEPEAQPASATRTTRTTRRQDNGETAPVEKKRKKGRPSKSHGGEQNGFVSPEPQQAGTSKITLPMADTPVIQRNKELRGAAKSGKGNRRSSLGMRGRRASSLIDSGASNALPHDQVDTAEFYKHIAADLPEPRRMRQLLIWCATRAMSDKRGRSEDASARLAARVIQEELLKDFSTNSQLSNWFEREDVNPPAVIVKKPNPKNIQNADKIKELEEQIQRLQRERHALNALLRPPSIPQIKPLKQQDTAPDGQQEPRQSDAEPKPRSEPEPIDLSLLDPSQQNIYESIDPDSAKWKPDSETRAASSSELSLPPVTPSAISTRLSRITHALAPTLDSLAAGIHDIELYRTMSDTVSSRVLRICAERLDERDAGNAMRRLAAEEGEGEGESKNLTLRPRPREDLGLILGALSRIER
ncbi:Mis12-Mtw1 protein family-domain-containing protein [Aspergillus pseudonomiae]|uniref:Mis12-Mtw1 protein family-domain-containing protein n=1 Tax=Aspergillus pseudonomiae TaxID=1506151 RepID=A0A5N6HJ55_9EURO|nr:Mis12-Mtw1 protein family-domain-containing protein [Aspergillus pseudonomiae]KAB8254268.1 Mis12-Mtw1 protein family-domain-containing protein [Aspergillus pseudonomiae]KAE8398002.1 Mis12-Mtw1 protein family-domain-containing protein [Aspergillus pseudonomiae]